VNDLASVKTSPRSGVRARLGWEGLTAAARGDPAGLDRGDVLKRPGSLFARHPEQEREDLGGDERIAGRAVAGGVLQSEVDLETVETAGADSPDQPPRQPHRAQPRPVQREVARSPQLRGDESPVEARVVGDEDPPRERRQHLIRDCREARGVAHHVVRDAGDRADQRRNRSAGIHQRIEHHLAPPALNHDDGDLRNPIVPAGPHSGGLDVHHGERALVEQRGALRLRDQAPASVGELSHPRIGPEECDGDPITDRAGGAGETDDRVTELER
jgi:hypothetical protein